MLTYPVLTWAWYGKPEYNNLLPGQVVETLLYNGNVYDYKLTNNIIFISLIVDESDSPNKQIS